MTELELKTKALNSVLQDLEVQMVRANAAEAQLETARAELEAIAAKHGQSGWAATRALRTTADQDRIDAERYRKLKAIRSCDIWDSIYDQDDMNAAVDALPEVRKS